ncbi:hypothetical protein [Pandoraea apista]|uniref:Transmembrane protein n=1 Tax=Pandoraea apista TaxID=93218 RepID=A0A5E5NYE7_9BURK|nr:hypothetical protein [Pandoraea apista]OXS94946.1 hypothetical protein B7H01_10700 [Pandoraea apista]PTE02186.1 hypothetical protein C7830_04735 [Pandoraea apista]RRJ34625.1 hypothetical protein EIB05_02650 [Pandoraea apista]RRJ80751.1 hypothetical protein EIL82_06955 [Pandoraea apista]RSD16982.1 hypothetical protein EIZ52_14180 [Pandoraea apista]
MKLVPQNYISLGFDAVPPPWPSDKSSVSPDWRHVGVRQHAPVLGEVSPPADASPTIDTLRESILESFATIKRDWNAAAQTVSPAAVRGKLSDEYGVILRLSEAVAMQPASDLLGIDGLIRLFEGAVDNICTARDISLTKFTIRRVDSQRSISDPVQLMPKARAALEALGHLKAALDTMVCASSARRLLEDKREALDGAKMTPEALKQAKAELHAAFEVTGNLLSKTEPLIHHYLTQAQLAIPAEKRRWKTKIAILATFLVITVSLGVASIVVPALLPALAGLALGLKFATTGMGIVTALNGICNVFAYARNRGWSQLSTEITAVKNLNDAVNRGIEARHGLHQSGATTQIQERLDKINHDITHATHHQHALDRKLDTLDHVPMKN